MVRIYVREGGKHEELAGLMVILKKPVPRSGRKAYLLTDEVDIGGGWGRRMAQGGEDCGGTLMG